MTPLLERSSCERRLEHAVRRVSSRPTQELDGADCSQVALVVVV